MKRNKEKLISILLMMTTIVCIANYSYSHSGRTDSNGGHKDNKNKSGLGSYHYHCGGNPAHLHTNGVCPYSSKASSNKSSKSNSTSSKTTKTSVPTTISASSVAINEKINEIEVGEKQKLTVTIMPDNVTEKNIIWKSSNESIVTINTLGEITAKKAGKVEVTANTSNAKTDTIVITVKEKNIIENRLTNSEKNSKTETHQNTNNSNPLGIIVAIVLLGGAGYLGYKKYKK